MFLTAMLIHVKFDTAVSPYIPWFVVFLCRLFLVFLLFKMWSMPNLRV